MTTRVCLALIRSHPAFLLLPILAGLLAGPASAACKSEAPQDILQCLQWAYADRDSAAYAEMLTDDFRLYNYGPDSTFYDHDVAVHAAVNLFHRVSSIRLEIMDGWKVEPAEAPDSWMVERVSAKVTLEPATAPGKPIEDVSNGNTLYVRRVAGPEPRIMIYKWVHALAPLAGAAATPAAGSGAQAPADSARARPTAAPAAAAAAAESSATPAPDTSATGASGGK